MRTTATLVKTIIEVDAGIAPTDNDLLPFISVANVLVTDCCTGSRGPVVPYDDARLELIERWLSAHVYCTRDPRVQSEGAAGLTATYQSVVSQGLANSHYGQMAMTLDTAGGLAAMNAATLRGAKRKASIVWLGTPPCL